MVVNLVDSNFTGRDLTLNPRFFKWCVDNRQVSKNIFFTDYQLKKVERLKTDQNKIAWLLEPKAILPDIYTYIENNFHNFFKVLTYDRELLAKIDNGLFCPYGTYWVEDKINYNKSKLISIIASYKNFTPGQALRHQIINLFENKLDVYGRHPNYKTIETKNEGLDNYYFSVTVENSIQNSYWTEKLLDCFITKTIPIYYGTKDVKNFFNKKGIIFFSDLNELSYIINNISEKIYTERLDIIEENYILAKKYKDPEDYIFHNYKDLLI